MSLVGFCTHRGRSPWGYAIRSVPSSNRFRLSSMASEPLVSDLSATISLRPTRIALLGQAVGPLFDSQIHADLYLSLGRYLQPDHSRVSKSTPGLAP